MPFDSMFIAVFTALLTQKVEGACMSFSASDQAEQQHSVI